MVLTKNINILVLDVFYMETCISIYKLLKSTYGLFFITNIGSESRF